MSRGAVVAETARRLPGPDQERLQRLAALDQAFPQAI